MPTPCNQPRIPVDNAKTLSELIDREMRVHGPQCDLNHLDVSGIRELPGLFRDSPFDGDISKWDVSNLTMANGMFYNSAFMGDISQWRTPKLRAAVSMFRGSKFNGDLSEWDVSSVREADAMFAGSAFEGDISKWDISSMTSFDKMFYASKCKSDLSTWTLPARCKEIEWMFNETFEGVLPQLGLFAPLSQYNVMMGSAKKLHQYLAVRPFSHVHAKLLVVAKAKPRWASNAVFKGVKECQAMYQALGMKGQSDNMHGYILERFGQAPASESFSLEGLDLS